MQDLKPDGGAHNWLDELPIPVLGLDDTGTIRKLNRAFEELVDLSRAEIFGSNEQSFPSTHRALLRDEELIYLNGPGLTERWLRCTRSPDAQDPSLTNCFYFDATREIQLEQENTKLREQVEALQLTDELTGLPNRKALTQQLELHVSRSRRYANPLSMIQVRLDVAPEDDTLGPSMVATARYLRDRLRWVDQIARWDELSFLIILPETGEAEATEVQNNLQAQRDRLQLSDEFGAMTVGFHCSRATWQRGDDARTLLRRTQQSLQQADSRTSTA